MFQVVQIYLQCSKMRNFVPKYCIVCCIGTGKNVNRNSLDVFGIIFQYFVC